MAKIESPFYSKYMARGGATISLESRGDTSVFRRVHQTYSMDDFIQDVIDRVTGFNPNKNDFSLDKADVMFGLELEVTEEQQNHRIANGAWDAELTSAVETDVLNVMVSVYGGTLKEKDGNTIWKLEGKLSDKSPVVPDENQIYTKAGIARYIVAGQSDVDTACSFMNRAPFLMPVAAAKVYGGTLAVPKNLFSISNLYDGSGHTVYTIADYLLDPLDSTIQSSVHPVSSTEPSDVLASVYYTQYQTELRAKLKESGQSLPRAASFKYNKSNMSTHRAKSLLSWAAAPKDSLEYQQFMTELGSFMPSGITSVSMSKTVGNISSELFLKFLERCSFSTSFSTLKVASADVHVDHVAPYTDVDKLPFSVVPSDDVGSGMTNYKLTKVSTLGAKAYYSQIAMQKMRGLIKYFINLYRQPGIQATDFSNLSNNDFFGQIAENADSTFFRSMFNTINETFGTNYSINDKPPGRLEVVLPYSLDTKKAKDFLGVLRAFHPSEEKSLVSAMLLPRYRRPHVSAQVKLRLNIPSEAQTLAALGKELATSKSTQETDFVRVLESFGGAGTISRGSMFEAINRALPAELKTSAPMDDYISFDNFPADAAFYINRLLLIYVQNHGAEMSVVAEQLVDSRYYEELYNVVAALEDTPDFNKMREDVGVADLFDGGGPLSILRWFGAYFTGFFSYEIPAGVAHYMSQVAMKPDSDGLVEPVFTMNVQEILTKMLGCVVDVPRVDGSGVETVERGGREMPSFSVPESKIAEVQQRRERMGISTANSYCSKTERMSVSADGVATFFPEVDVNRSQQNLIAYSDLMERRYALYADIGIAPAPSLSGIELRENLKHLVPSDPADREEFNKKVEEIQNVEKAMLRMQPCPLMADGSLGILMGAKAQDLNLEKFETQSLATNGPIGEDLLAGYLKESKLSSRAWGGRMPSSLTQNYPALWALLVEAKQVPSIDEMFIQARAKWEELAGAEFVSHFSPEAEASEDGLSYDGSSLWPVSVSGVRSPRAHERTYTFDYTMPDALIEACEDAGMNISAALDNAKGREDGMRTEAAKFEMIVLAAQILCGGGYANYTTAGRIDNWIASVVRDKIGHAPSGQSSEDLIENFDHLALADTRDIDSDEVFEFGQAMGKKLGKHDFHTHNFYLRYLKTIDPIGEDFSPFKTEHGNYLRYYVAGQLFLDMIEAMFAAFCKPDCVLYSPLIPAIGVDWGDIEDGGVSIPATPVELPSFLSMTQSVIPNLFRIHLAGNRPRNSKFEYKRDSTAELLRNGKTFGIELEMPYAHGSIMSHQAAVELGQEFSPSRTTRHSISFRQIEPGGGKTISGIVGFLMEMNRDDVREYYSKVYTPSGEYAIDDPVLLQQELAKAPFRPIVVCPKNLKANWAADAIKFTGDKDSRFRGMLNIYQISSRVLASRPRELIHAEVLTAPPNTIFATDYSTINNYARRVQLCIGSQTFTTHETVNLLLQLGFTHIYFDEGHKVKNSNLALETGIRPTCTRLAQDALARDNSQVVIATGTGVHNTLDDLAGLASTLQPGSFGDMDTYNKIAGRSDTEVSTKTYTPEHVRNIDTHMRKIVNVTRLGQAQWAYVLPTPVYITHVIDTLENTNGSLDKVVQFGQPKSGSNSADMKVAIEYLWNRGFFKKWQLTSIDEVLAEFTNYFAIYWANMTEAINKDVISFGKKTGVKGSDDDSEEDDDDDLKAELDDDDAGALYELYVKLMQFLGDPLNDDLNNPGDPLNGASVYINGGRVVLPKLRLPPPKMLYLYYLLYKHFEDNLAHEAGKIDSSRPIPGRKVVVASKHKRVLASVLQGLPEDLRSHSTMVMGTIDTDKISAEFKLSAKDAQNNLESFKQNDNTWLMFCTTDKMGEGFNLQMGNRIISLEQPVTPGERLQLVSRVRRPDIGQNYQRDEVYLESIVQDGTLDMTMFGLFASKYCTMTYASNTNRPDNPLYDKLSELPRLKLNLKTFANVYTWEKLRDCDVSSFMDLPEYMKGKNYDYVKGIETCYEADRVDCAKLLEHNLKLARAAGEAEGDPLKYLVPVMRDGVQAVNAKGEKLYKPYLLQSVKRTDALAGTAPMLFAPALENVPNAHARIFGFDVESMQTMLDVYDDYSKDDMLVGAMPVVTEFGFGRILGYDRSSVVVLFPNGMRKSFPPNLITLLGNVTQENKRFLNIMLDVEDYNEQVSKADFGEKVLVTPAHCEFEYVPGKGVQKWRVVLRNGTYERTEKLGPIRTEDANDVSVVAGAPYLDVVATIPPFSRSQRIMLPIARVQMNGIFWYNEHLYRIVAIKNKESGRVSIDALSANAVGIMVICREVSEANGDFTEIGNDIPFLYRDLCAQGLHIEFVKAQTTVQMIWSFLYDQRLVNIGKLSGSVVVARRTVNGKPVVYTRDTILEMLKSEIGRFVESYLGNKPYVFGGMTHADEYGTYLYDATEEGVKGVTMRDIYIRWTSNNQVHEEPLNGSIPELAMRAISELAGWFGAGSEAANRRKQFYRLVLNDIDLKSESSNKCLGLGSDSEIFAAGGVQNRIKQLGVAEGLNVATTTRRKVDQFTGEPTATPVPPPVATPTQRETPPVPTPERRRRVIPTTGQPVTPDETTTNIPQATNTRTTTQRVPTAAEQQVEPVVNLANAAGVSLQILPLMSAVGAGLKEGSFAPMLMLDFPDVTSAQEFLNGPEMVLRFGNTTRKFSRKDQFVAFAYSDLRIDSPEVYRKLLEFLKANNITLGDVAVLDSNKQIVGGSSDLLAKLVSSMQSDGSFNIKAHPQISNVRMHRFFTSREDYDQNKTKMTGSPTKFTANPVVMRDAKGERLHLLFRVLANPTAFLRLRAFVKSAGLAADALVQHKGRVVFTQVMPTAQHYKVVIDALRADLSLTPTACQIAEKEVAQLLSGHLIAAHTRR